MNKKEMYTRYVMFGWYPVVLIFCLYLHCRLHADKYYKNEDIGFTVVKFRR